MENLKAISVGQAAEILGVHANTIYDLLLTKQLKGFKVKSVWRIKITELEKFMNGVQK